MWGWRAFSDGFLLQDIMAAGVGEAGEKQDEPAAGEAVSPAAWRVASQGLAQHRGRRCWAGGTCCSVLVGEVS